MSEGRAILLIADGLGDRPVQTLGGHTPLEAAHTPNLDRLALQGECGIMDPIAPGVRPGSDTAHLALLGYDPHQVYTGRGPFEAMGIGMEVRPSDVCFRCNFSTVNDHMEVVDRRAGRINEGTAELAAAVNGIEFDGVKCIFKQSVEHRGALILRGADLGAEVSDVDPHQEGQHILQAHGGDAKSQRAADVLNKFVLASFDILRSHPVNDKRRAAGKLPANIVLPRGAGLAPHVQPFGERYGFSGACVVEVGLVKGIGRYLGMEVVEVAAATGGHDTDEAALAVGAIEASARHPFVLCNLKAPDLGGHDGDPNLKMRDIEKFENLAGIIARQVGGDVYLAITGDHSTPVSVGDHTGDPLPVIFWGPGVRPDQVREFGERSCALGGLGRIRGQDLMNMITNLTGRQEKFGA
jgi:2,3-bisphosphoglycerate-independent phosphoglycerate mutase